MKYLFLIIRHFFPRRRWKIIGETAVMDEDARPGDLPIKRFIILQDQFGNLRRFQKTL